MSSGPLAQQHSVQPSGSSPLAWGMITIELTERCNNACQHCCINLPEDDPSACERELTTDEWKTILRQAADLGVMTVRITGGEPLLRPDFTDLYLFIRRLGMDVILFTNARRITPELAQLFARIPPRQVIEVSVYGLNPSSYDAVACAPGAFAEFQRGVDLLLEYKVPFILKGALLPETRDEVDEFTRRAAAIPWMDRPPSYAMFFDLRARRDSPARNQHIARLRATPEEGLRILASSPDAYRREMRLFCGQFMRPGGEALFTCGAGQELTIDAYGHCQPCMGLRHPDFTVDLRTTTLQNALDHFAARLPVLKTANPSYLERCSVCFIKGLCEQCPAKSYAEHGTLDTPVEYFCQVAHAQARYLGLLDEGENAWEVTDGTERVKRMSMEEKKA